MGEVFRPRWQLLQYLRWNSDSEHPVHNGEALRRDPVMDGFFRDKTTLRKAVQDLANALNCDENGSRLPPEQWRILSPACLKEYEDTSDEPDDAPSKNKRASPIVHNFYYRHTFAYEEINALIEGVLFSRTLDTKTAKQLVEKIETHLTTKFYRKGPKNICKVREPALADQGRIRENLLLLQRAIDIGVKAAFQFNGYDRLRKLIPVRERRTVSPYYIAAYAGRYYLLACTEGQESMSIWRVDLMTELEVLDQRALEKKNVKGLPQEWDETFFASHLNMSYDTPVPITLRIVNPWQGTDGKEWTNYTFLYDYFGDNVRYERTETEPPYGDIVRVMCSPFGMVNWALQYADRVEVLEPASVRDEVGEKVRKLNRTYGEKM